MHLRHIWLLKKKKSSHPKVIMLSWQSRDERSGFSYRKYWWRGIYRVHVHPLKLQSLDSLSIYIYLFHSPQFLSFISASEWRILWRRNKKQSLGFFCSYKDLGLWDSFKVIKKRVFEVFVQLLEGKQEKEGKGRFQGNGFHVWDFLHWRKVGRSRVGEGEIIEKKTFNLPKKP